MNIYINSEKYVINNTDRITYDNIIEIAGYPLSDNYIIIDEVNNIQYHKYDTILLKNNISLMIKKEVSHNYG